MERLRDKRPPYTTRELIIFLLVVVVLSALSTFKLMGAWDDWRGGAWAYKSGLEKIR